MFTTAVANATTKHNIPSRNSVARIGAGFRWEPFKEVGDHGQHQQGIKSAKKDLPATKDLRMVKTSITAVADKLHLVRSQAGTVDIGD